MKSSQWRDPAFTTASVGLEEELEKIFEQVEIAVKKAGPVPEELLPRLEILPDDFEASEDGPRAGGPGAPRPSPSPARAASPSPSSGRTEASAPPEASDDPILSGDFHLAAARISPADDQDAPFELPDFEGAEPAGAWLSPAGHQTGDALLDMEDDQPHLGELFPMESEAPPLPARPAGERPGREDPGPLPARERPESAWRFTPADFRIAGAEAEKIIAATAKALTPEELARLIERAVERGVLAALKKWER